MFSKSSLNILAVCLLAFSSVEMVSAKGDYVTDYFETDENTAQEFETDQMSRMELQAALMRFAQMFVREFTFEIYSLERQSKNQKVRLALSRGELRAVNTVLQIVTGPDPVDNLLDMVIFLSLARISVEKNWDASALGIEKGRLPDFLRQMEKAIWAIARKVMIPRYQKELRGLIGRWQARHPKQFYMERIGIDNLSEMLEESVFKDAGKPGFLLPEVNEATRSVDEARNLAERMAFFVKYLPYVLRTTAETGMYEFFAQPETVQLLYDINRLTTAIDGMGSTVNKLPDRLSKEREIIMTDILESEVKLRALLDDIQKSLVLGDEMAAAATEAATSIAQAAAAIDTLVKRIHSRSEPGSFDILQWFKTVREVNETVKQTQVLVDMSDKFLTNLTRENLTLEQGLAQIKKGFDALFWRALVGAAVLIVFFFVVQLIFRTISRKTFKEKSSSPSIA